MMSFDQISIFDIGKTPLKITKPIRLIELFAGIGSQAKALERLGVDFEHYRISEWEVSAVASYKAIHKGEDNTDYSNTFSNEELTDLLYGLGISTDGKTPLSRKEIARRSEQWKREVYNNFVATNNIGSVVNICGRNLGIVDTDKYEYILTYSFPCQDLSLAGKQKGMAKGGNTRSGLLWEVERLLNECDELPQILLMENVTQVHGTKNLEHFRDWIEFLESKGYSNYWEDLNAKNYGIPQNRNRTFMVSVLGDYTYEFPKPIPLELRLKDMLEDSVDEKYYLSEKLLNFFVNHTEKQKAAGNGFAFKPTNGDVIAKAGTRTDDNYIEEPSVKQIGNLFESKTRENPNQGRLYDKDGLSPTLGAMQGGNRQPFVVDEPKVIGGIGEKKSNGGTQWYQQDRIYDNEVAMSVTTGFLPYYKTEEPSINRIDIPQTVKVRKYPVDTDRLCEVLRDHKQSLGYSNQDIADHLDVPLTKVEHWFRRDKSFAIPDEDIWLELKALLGIGTDEFDKAIMTFEEKEGVFEKSNRCYISDGLAPTITSASADEKIIEPFVVASRGRNPENPSDRTAVCPTQQRLEPNLSGCSNTLTTVQKDNLLVEPLAYDEQNGYIRKDGTQITSNDDLSRIRIRKLTPRECYRLMGFDDEDFNKAAQCNSNAQLYKQAGNSIVVDVLVAIFKNMF